MKNNDLRILFTYLKKGKKMSEGLKVLDFEFINIL